MVLAIETGHSALQTTAASAASVASSDFGVLIAYKVESRRALAPRLSYVAKLASAMSPTQPAPAAVGIDPVLLHQEVLRADLHVRSRAVRRCVGRPEVPGALVGVLVARVVVPGIEVFVGVGLFRLVRQGVDLGVGRGAGAARRDGGGRQDPRA